MRHIHLARAEDRRNIRSREAAKRHDAALHATLLRDYPALKDVPSHLWAHRLRQQADTGVPISARLASERLEGEARRAEVQAAVLADMASPGYAERQASENARRAAMAAVRVVEQKRAARSRKLVSLVCWLVLVLFTVAVFVLPLLYG